SATLLPCASVVCSQPTVPVRIRALLSIPPSNARPPDQPACPGPAPPAGQVLPCPTQPHARRPGNAPLGSPTRRNHRRPVLEAGGKWPLAHRPMGSLPCARTGRCQPLVAASHCPDRRADLAVLSPRLADVLPATRLPPQGASSWRSGRTAKAIPAKQAAGVPGDSQLTKPHLNVSKHHQRCLAISLLNPWA